MIKKMWGYLTKVVLLANVQAFCIGATAYSQTQVPNQKQRLEPKKNKDNLQNNNSSQDKNKNLLPETQSPAEEEEGLFGPVRIGPMVGFGVLMGPSVGLEAKIFKYWGLSFSYAQYNDFNVFSVYDFRSALNKNSQDFTVNTAKINYKQMEGKISFFPWGETFFIGTAFGKRDITLTVGGTVNTTIAGFPSAVTVPINVEYGISSLYLTPQIGWLASWDGPYGGFAIGTEFGAQFSISNTESLTPSTSGIYAPYLEELKNTTQYQEMRNQILSEAGDKITKYPLPYWNIIKVGWLF